MQAGQRPVHLALDDAVEQHLEARAVLGEQARLPLAAFAGGLHRGPAAHPEYALQGFLGARANDQALARHSAHQMVELPLDGREVGEDIRVVEFQVVQDRRARAVMDELRALVEEGAVVLVGLDHEERRTAQARRNPEVLRHPADQEARAHAGVLQNPGEHAGGGGLAVGTGHRQHPASLQHVVGQPLRAGNVGQALVQDMLHRRIAARQGVADHYQVRRRLQVGRIVALHQLDALGLQLGAHGGVDVGVGTGHPVAQFLGQHGQRAHEGPADAEYVDVHADSCRSSRRRRCEWAAD